MDKANVSQNTYDFYNLAGPKTIPNFQQAGLYNNGQYGAGNVYGSYWSSIKNRRLLFINYAVWTNSNGDPHTGFSVRCLAR